jgi:hypothetical protein
MANSEIQIQFFQHLKNIIPHYKSLVDEISDLLGISNDSAYRRIRGEKYIDLEEIKKISQHFNISLDQVFNLQTNAIVFHGKLNSFTKDSFEFWLEDVLKQFQMLHAQKNKHIYYHVKDMPPFYQLYFPELASFKFFFFMKSILFYDSLKYEKFTDENLFYFKVKDTCNKIIQLYNQLPTTEIWNEEGINATIRQIDIYYEMGWIPSKDLAITLYNQLLETVNHLESQAEVGLKYHLGKSPTPESAPYHLFVNEFVIGDNSFFTELDNVRITYLNHSVLYFIGSMDPKFNDAMFSNLDNLMKKSTMISTTGEKDRGMFFNKLRKKIEEKILNIK